MVFHVDFIISLSYDDDDYGSFYKVYRLIAHDLVVRAHVCEACCLSFFSSLFNLCSSLRSISPNHSLFTVNCEAIQHSTNSTIDSRCPNCMA